MVMEKKVLDYINFLLDKATILARVEALFSLSNILASNEEILEKFLNHEELLEKFFKHAKIEK